MGIRRFNRQKVAMGQTRGTIVCYTAGALFGVGWWLLIGTSIANRNSNDPVPPAFVHYLPGIFASIALVMINMVSWSALNDNVLDGGSTAKARAWLFAWLTVLFACAIAGYWVAFDNGDWFGENKKNFPGVALILNVSLITVAALLYRFARGSDD